MPCSTFGAHAFVIARGSQNEPYLRPFQEGADTSAVLSASPAAGGFSS